MKILYGTSNKGKLAEINRIIRLEGLHADVITLKDIHFNEEIIENGKTFEENSMIKAEAIKKFCDKNGIDYEIIITDDAGLCVDFLDGRPGVYSARYAGENATQEQILNKLLDEMEDAKEEEQRTCAFVCVLSGILKDGTKIVKRGETKGRIAYQISKLGGLTYNPVFIPNGFDKTVIEMEDEEFQKVHNHRMAAIEALLSEIKVYSK
ncbi:MAG: non-canonical purine NTP pyrophosphatase [Clostridia bacterium]